MEYVVNNKKSITPVFSLINPWYYFI